MITLENYELFVSESTSKKGNDYCALYIKVGEKNIFLTYITDSVYNYISNLSK